MLLPYGSRRSQPAATGKPSRANRVRARLGCERLEDRAVPAYANYATWSLSPEGGSFSFDASLVDASQASQTLPVTDLIMGEPGPNAVPGVGSNTVTLRNGVILGANFTFDIPNQDGHSVLVADADTGDYTWDFGNGGVEYGSVTCLSFVACPATFDVTATVEEVSGGGGGEEEGGEGQDGGGQATGQYTLYVMAGWSGNPVSGNNATLFTEVEIKYPDGSIHTIARSALALPGAAGSHTEEITFTAPAGSTYTVRSRLVDTSGGVYKTLGRDTIYGTLE